MQIFQPNVFASHWLALFSPDPDRRAEPMPAKPRRLKRRRRDLFDRSSEEFYAGRHSYLDGLDRVACPFATGDRRERWLMGWNDAELEFRRSSAPVAVWPAPHARPDAAPQPSAASGFGRPLRGAGRAGAPKASASDWSEEELIQGV